MPVWHKRFHSKHTTQQLPRIAFQFFMPKLMDLKNGQSTSHSEAHIIIKCSLSSLVLSPIETLASHESLDSESHVKADSIWLCSFPTLDCLRKHLLDIQYWTFMPIISEAFQPNSTYQLEYCDCPCVSAVSFFSVIGCLHIPTHSFCQYWQYNRRLTSFRHSFLGSTKMRPMQVYPVKN